MFNMFNTHNLEGKTLIGIKVSVSGDNIYLCTTDGAVYRIQRTAWCSEAVKVESVTGNLSDLVGRLLVKVEVKLYNSPDKTCSWKEFIFKTKEHTVTIKWSGSWGEWGEHKAHSTENVSLTKEDFMLHEGMSHTDIRDKIGIPLEDIPDILMMLLLMPKPMAKN